MMLRHGESRRAHLYVCFIGMPLSRRSGLPEPILNACLRNKSRTDTREFPEK